MKNIYLNLVLYVFQSTYCLCFQTSREYSQQKMDIINHPNWPTYIQDQCGISYADRIIGGVNASLGQYPWLVRIGYKKNSTTEYECGGALITVQYVLTAAHCVTNLEPNVQVKIIVLGENNAQSEIDCEKDICADPIQILKPKQIILPANYNEPPFKHDIALIQLNGNVTLTDWVSPICLPFGQALKAKIINEMGEVAGWGLTNSENKRGTDFLQTVKLPILTINQCKSIYGRGVNIGTEQLCVGGLVGRDSCAGDSGGPLVKVEKSLSGPRYFIYGVVSFGAKRCGETPTPGVYTNVRHYLLWILNNLK